MKLVGIDDFILPNECFQHLCQNSSIAIPLVIPNAIIMVKLRRLNIQKKHINWNSPGFIHGVIELSVAGDKRSVNIKTQDRSRSSG